MENVPGAIYRCALDDIWKMQPSARRSRASPATRPPTSSTPPCARSCPSPIPTTATRSTARSTRRSRPAARSRSSTASCTPTAASAGCSSAASRRSIATAASGSTGSSSTSPSARRPSSCGSRARPRRAAAASSRRRARASSRRPTTARRRIERDLHDGAQQRLVVASIQLRAAERRRRRRPGRGAARGARAELDAGLEELRELARGIHPALLTERGLGPAVHALARRCTVPVELEDELGGASRPPVETALYYTIAEALTNVERYAGASARDRPARRRRRRRRGQVSDDGRGGADGARGSGLRGLEDRIEALGGTTRARQPARRGAPGSARACRWRPE